MDELGQLRDGATMAAPKVVDHYNVMAQVEQVLDGHAADVACPTRHRESHSSSICSRLRPSIDRGMVHSHRLGHVDARSWLAVSTSERSDRVQENP